MSTAHAHTLDNHDHGHSIPLWGLFLALLALTAAEVGLYEVWLHSAKHSAEPFMPKYVMVLVILIVLTLPKAAIVMIYFMHLKFEKHFVIGLAIVPIVFAAICVLPTLADIRVNRPFVTTRPAVIKGHDLDAHGEHVDHPEHSEPEVTY